jgi:hypothetical protein
LNGCGSETGLSTSLVIFSGDAGGVDLGVIVVTLESYVMKEVVVR